MFGLTQSTSNSNQYQSHRQLAYSKREQFRMQIRRNQIEQIKKQIRNKLFRFKDPNDARMLCKIDLNRAIHDLKNSGITSQIVHSMFLYATSNSADHLYTLFDQKVIEILIDNMIQRQFENSQYLHEQEREKNSMQLERKNSRQGQLKWDREIFWILTNFTSQSTVLHEKYMQNLYRIADYVYKIDQMKEDAHNRNQLTIPITETQQNIVLSLSNLLMQSSNCREIIYNYQNLFYRIFKRFYKRKPRPSDLIKKNNGRLPMLVIYYCQFLHNIYSCIEYDQINEHEQKQALKQIRRILFAMTNERLLEEEDKKVVLLFLDSITKLFGHTLDNKPQYLMTHQKQFWKLSEWFETFMKNQMISQKCNEIILSYINLLRVVYGPNIPEDIQYQVNQFYVKFFEKHVGKVCSSAFMNNNEQFHLRALMLLQPIMMQQFMAELIVMQYLQIVSHIFLHIKNSNYNLKKQALICLVNMLKSTIYQNSSSQGQILQLLLANKVADIFANNIWAYTDNELNLDLLEGIKLLLEAQTNQYESKLRFWTSFEEAGGIIKLETLINQAGNGQLKSETIKILDSAKDHQQM